MTPYAYPEERPATQEIFAIDHGASEQVPLNQSIKMLKSYHSDN
jgi:hypothetical protein